MSMTWDRHAVLSCGHAAYRLLAHAFLAVATADERDRSPAPDGLIMLIVNEFRRLFDALLLGAHRTLARLLHWSTWRRRHQHRARRCHYQRHQPQ